MTDYKSIADAAVSIIGSADPTQYQAAYDVMVAQTVDSEVTEEVRVTEGLILAALGTAAAIILIDKLSSIHASVARLLQGEGVNVISMESKGQTTVLLAQGFLTQSEHDWIVSHYTQTLPKWPGLKPGHVQNSLEYRLEGKI